MNNQIVCLGLSPWQSGVPARTEQLMARLATDAQVVYFEPPGVRRGGKGRQVRPNVMVYTLPAPSPLTPLHSALFRLWQRQAGAFIARMLERHRIHDPLLWVSNPEWYPMVRNLHRRGLIYDCNRYFSELPMEWESELAFSADLCLAASPALAAHLQPCNDNVVVLPNGCNYPVFAQIAPRRSSGKTVLTYCGTLREDLDLSPLLACAEAHPEWEFRLAGGSEERFPAKSLGEQYPNLRFTGAYNPREMAAILDGTDLCINLLRRSQQLPDLIPNRIFEYLASGRPIVSMLYPDQIEVFADTIYGASSSREFISCCERALLETNEALPERRRRHAQHASWAGRAQQVADILNSIGLYS